MDLERRLLVAEQAIGDVDSVRRKFHSLDHLIPVLSEVLPCFNQSSGGTRTELTGTEYCLCTTSDVA